MGRAGELIESIRDAAGELSSLDLTALSPQELGGLLQQVEAARARVDALVNGAGVWREGPVEECSEADFDAVVDVNLKGTYFMCAAAIPHL